jgi:arylsulfatase A-like enzyme
MAGASAARPNFLFLIADDLTFNGIRAMGNAEVETPNLDRLIGHGVTFTHCFHQGSWQPAVCVASRTMLNCGMTAFRAQQRIEQSPLWGETMGKAGYETAIAGKWHLSSAALDRSFKRQGKVSPAGGGQYLDAVGSVVEGAAAAYEAVAGCGAGFDQAFGADLGGRRGRPTAGVGEERRTVSAVFGVHSARSAAGSERVCG